MIQHRKWMLRIALLLLAILAVGMLLISSCYATHTQAVRRAEKFLSVLSESAVYHDPRKQALLTFVCEGFGAADAFPIRERPEHHFRERFGWPDLLYCNASKALLQREDFILQMDRIYESGRLVFLYRRGFAQADTVIAELTYYDPQGNPQTDSFTFSIQNGS